MKALPFKIPKTQERSFHIQIDDEPYFYDKLHQHPEIQLTLIEESTGNLIYGDHLGMFMPGDMFVIGPNIPHVFRNDNDFYKGDDGLRAKGHSLFFDENTFGEGFFGLPEVRRLAQIIQYAERGMKLNPEHAYALAPMIKSIFKAEGLDRIILLLQILNRLSEPNAFEYLTNQLDTKPISDDQGKRLDDIFRFTLQEYYRPIKLEEVASVANMSPSAFCRYFKQHTRKTYIDFLNEYRIGQACKLLMKRDKQITEVCFEVGFGNLSNFNRKFKEFTGTTPKNYSQRMKINLER